MFSQDKKKNHIKPNPQRNSEAIRKSCLYINCPFLIGWYLFIHSAPLALKNLTATGRLDLLLCLKLYLMRSHVNNCGLACSLSHV